MFWQQLEQHLHQYVSQSWTHYADVKQSTKIVYDPTDVNRFNNRYNIDFLPNDDQADNHREFQVFFSNLILKELQLHRLPLYGNIDGWRERLKRILIVEQKLDLVMREKMLH